MPIDEQIMERVHESDREAIEAVINQCFPAVHRVAHALTGEPAIAQRIVRFVLRRGVGVMPRWRPGLVAENWFYHHTLLTTREVTRRPPSPQRDLLLTAGPATEPAYAAFIRALRGLHVQQMEAFILHHGEKLNTRLLAVAMDLSTQAAAAHLAAATTALQTIAGDQFGAMTSALERAYTSLTPPETIVRSQSKQEIRSVFWRRLFRRVVRRLVLLVILAALAAAVWRWHELLLHWFNMVRSAAQTQKG